MGDFKLKRIYLLIVMCCTVSIAGAQEFESFDREKWKDITKDIDYAPGTDGQYSSRSGQGRNTEGLQRGRQEEPQGEPISSGGTIFPFGGMLFKVIVIAVFIGLLVFVISKLAGNNVWVKNKKRNQEYVVPGNLEDHLMETDLMKWLRKAVEDKDYRLAIRIYYLMIIKALADKGFINWKKEKTNLDYLYEMRDHSSHMQLRELTTIYQLAWYGEKDLGDGYLLEASHQFKAYFQSINAVANG